MKRLGAYESVAVVCSTSYNSPFSYMHGTSAELHSQNEEYPSQLKKGGVFNLFIKAFDRQKVR